MLDASKPFARPSLAVLAMLAALAGSTGCGEGPRGPKRDASPGGVAASGGAGTAVAREAPSSDPAVAEIQQKIAAARAQGRLDTAVEGWRSGGVPMRLPTKPAAAFDPQKTYLWALHTDVGTLRFRLRPDRAPRHVANTVYLTLLGFYDGTPFYRVAPGKAVEGGCPRGDGAGSPGFAIESEGTREENAHDRRGLLASTGVGGSTDDSKFRVLLAPDPSFDAFGTVYGELVEGEAVLAKLEADPTKRVVVTRAEVELR